MNNMYRYFVLWLLIPLIMSSCINDTNNVNLNENSLNKNDTLKLNNTNILVNEIDKYDTLEVFKTNALQTLNFILNGNIKQYYANMHPIFGEILMDEFPNTSIDKMIEETETSYLTSNTEALNREYNMHYVLGDIIDTIKYNNNLFYSIHYSRIGKTKFDEINESAILLGISTNNGKNWKFLNIGKKKNEIKKRLLMLYPKFIIDKLSNTFTGISKNNNDNSRYEANTDIEKNFSTQYNDYMQSALNGNYEKILNYIYPQVYIYLRDKYNPEQTVEEFKNYYADQMINGMKQAIDGLKRKPNVTINKVLNKVEYKNYKIFVFSYSLFSNEKDEAFSVGGEAIAISKNNGVDWTFFEKDDEMIIPILTLEFPNSIITKILNYNYEK